MLPALEVWSFNHWTTREVTRVDILKGSDKLGTVSSLENGEKSPKGLKKNVTTCWVYFFYQPISCIFLGRKGKSDNQPFGMLESPVSWAVGHLRSVHTLTVQDLCFGSRSGC